MYKVSGEAKLINRRFFEAIDALKRDRRLSGIYGFSLKYNLSHSNLFMIKSREQGVVNMEYLTYLVRDFGISAHWLLTGEGDMFIQTPSRTE